MILRQRQPRSGFWNASENSKMRTWYLIPDSETQAVRPWSNAIIGKIRRAFAQGVSDHGHCVFFQELAATSPTTSWFQSNKKCSEYSNTFFNRFWLTFVSTLTNWTELLIFSATYSLFLHRLRFFCNRSRTMANNCSNNCFLFEKARARGVAFGEPSSHPASPLSPPRRGLILGGYNFLGLISRSFFFCKKMHFGSKHGSKIVWKLTREATADATFTFFQGTMILKDPPLILVYF